MIKVGDYLRFKRIIHGFVNESIDRVEDIVPTPNNKYMIYFENLEHGILFDDLYDSRIADYKSLYEQQKEVADRAEKRWETLRGYLENESTKWEPIYSENVIVGKSLVENDEIKISDVLQEMKDLEEDGE